MSNGRQVIGSFELKVATEFTNRSYECADWWKTILVPAGTYEVVRYLNHIDYIYYVSLPGTIVRDYFGARLGATSLAYDVNQNSGKPSAYSLSMYSFQAEKDARFLLAVPVE